MSKDLFHISLTRKALEAPRLPGGGEFGSRIEFSGVVREIEAGRTITGIHYSAYEPMARREMVRIAEEARSRFSRHGLWMEHRIGFVPAGEASLLLLVATPHSADGYEISRWLLRQLKTRVPVWKEPRFANSAPTPA